MKVNRYKFMFISAFCIAKLMAAYTYISLSEDLDYLFLFENYCEADFGEGKGGFDVLNTVHFFLFRPGCSLGAVVYFWVFVFIQLILLVVAFGKLYKYNGIGTEIPILSSAAIEVITIAKKKFQLKMQ